MRLLQIFLPLSDNEGKAFPKALFDTVRDELTAAFGGVTAFVRSPAIGLWEGEEGAVRRDDIVLFEVVVDALNADWWSAFKSHLEEKFHQDLIMIRAMEIDIL